MGFPVPRKKPETIWLNYVRQRLRLAFGPSVRMVKIMGGLGQEPGISDLICCIQGRAVALELKTPGGRHRLSPYQASFLDSWRQAGGVGMVIDSEESLRECIGLFEVRQGRLF